MLKVLFSLLLCFFTTVSGWGVNEQLNRDPKAIVHFLNRISYGATAAQFNEVKEIGINQYLWQQLHPDLTQLPKELALVLARIKNLTLSSEELLIEFKKQLSQTPQPRYVAISRNFSNDFKKNRLLRALKSPHQLYENMVDFWFNHFNVTSKQNYFQELWIGPYERDAIRPYALGKFSDLLLAVAGHPVMLIYLDNVNNFYTKQGKGLNENYAREVMELHTLGVNGGYTQQDIIELARILSGWTVAFQTTSQTKAGSFVFDKNRHDPFAKVFLGETFEAGKGVEEGERALTMLARHPSTAKFISFKLAQYFVADQPDPKLVDKMAETFLETDGEITAVLKTMFESSYFWDEKIYATKFKTPYQYLISTTRASGVKVQLVTPLAAQLYEFNMPLYECFTPDGYKQVKEAWLSPYGLLKRIDFARNLSEGRIPLPGLGVSFIVKDDVFISDLKDFFSQSTIEIINQAPEKYRAQLFLASPDLLRR
jgi:uncharacterized protein (DUF1800 family)